MIDDEAIAARLTARHFEAADTVFMDGSTPWEVDEAMVGFGFAMGPYETQDHRGLDAVETLMRMHGPRDEGRRVIPLRARMLELGKLGRKTGAGWYRYPGGGGKVEDPIVADLALEECHMEGRTRTDYPPQAIVERLRLALIGEALALLDSEPGVTPATIDRISVRSLGFPAARGGVLRDAATFDPSELAARFEALAAEDGVAWRVPRHLVDGDAISS